MNHVPFPQVFTGNVLFLFAFNCVCWGLSLRNLSTLVLGRLFKQAHVHAGIDFKKYDDIEVGLKVESGFEDVYIFHCCVTVVY